MASKRTTQTEAVVSTGAPAKPAHRQSVRRAARSAAPVETALEPRASSPSIAQPAAVTAPAHDEIARLAYSYWAARGGQDGSPEEDWTRAEQALRTRASAAAL